MLARTVTALLLLDTAAADESGPGAPPPHLPWRNDLALQPVSLSLSRTARAHQPAADTAPAPKLLPNMATAAMDQCPSNPSSEPCDTGKEACNLITGVNGVRVPPEHCAIFCNGSCPFHPRWSPGAPENLTLYRLTPRNVTGLADKDTGDAAGDAGFYTGFMFLHLLDCSPGGVKLGCFLADDPVITAFVVETDGRYGPYLKCNPRQRAATWVDTSVWDCTYGNGVPWFPAQGQPPQAWLPGTNGCACARANRTVGPSRYHIRVIIFLVEPCRLARVLKTVRHHQVGLDPVNHNENCSRPDAAGKIPAGCDSVGWWYSTPAAGRCTGAASPGDASGCTWRLVARAKTVNASCMRAHVVDFAVRENTACFASCGPVNVSSGCFRRCYSSTFYHQPGSPSAVSAAAIQASPGPWVHRARLRTPGMPPPC
jgi:hypothetical protein